MNGQTYIPLALKTPKLTDEDGRACTELGTGRDCHSLRCQNWSTSSQAGEGVLMSDLTAKPNFSCILSAANFYAALLPRRGRILRRTLSVRPVIVTERHVAPPSELQ